MQTESGGGGGGGKYAVQKWAGDRIVHTDDAD